MTPLGKRLPADWQSWPPEAQLELLTSLRAIQNQSVDLQVELPPWDASQKDKVHPKQEAFVNSTAKRNIVRAGRRGGKTVGIAKRAVKRFAEGARVLYAAPTQDQLDRFWVTVCRCLQKSIDSGVIYKNETRHILEVPGTERRIRAKTAWNADSLRGDYADELILDEWQLMNEDAWRLVGAPMLADKNGNATFIYTPPSLHSRSASKAGDPQHAAKLFKKALKDTSGRWAVFHFASKDNPFISGEALDDLTQDMSSLAYRMEIEAEDVDENPGALWTREIIERNRQDLPPEFEYVVVGVDPSATADGDEAGIVVAGRSRGHGYVLADCSIQGSPTTWAEAAVRAYHSHEANRIVAEANNGGEMVKLTIATVDPHVPVMLVHASRGKQTRAEPVSALYEQNRGHHIGAFPALEDEMSLWMPGDPSPNRMDALVWAFTDLRLFKWTAPPPTKQEQIIEELPQTLKPETIIQSSEDTKGLLMLAQQKKWAEIEKRLSRKPTRSATGRHRQEIFNK